MCDDEVIEIVPEIISTDDAKENPAVSVDGATDAKVEQVDVPQENATITEETGTPSAMLPPAWDELSAKLHSLESLFAKRLSYDAGKEKILDKLHSELQDYKSDIYAKLTRPIFYDVAVVLDDIRKIRAGLDSEKQADSDSLLESIADSLVFLLDKYEVLPYTSEPGTKYDATRQRMVRTEATSDPAQVGLITESVSAGYLQNNQVIYPEKIIAYKLEVM